MGCWYSPTAPSFYFWQVEVEMKVYITLMVLTVVLIGCSPKNSSTVKSGTPGEQGIPIQVTPFPSIIPTPIASKGTVVGKLERTTPGQSLTGLALYFGTILPLTPGPDHLINLDLANSPKAIISDDGRFIAENITPGEYVLVLWTPHDSRYVPDPKNSEQDFIVKVVSDQIVDVGTLQITPPQ